MPLNRAARPRAFPGRPAAGRLPPVMVRTRRHRFLLLLLLSLVLGWPLLGSAPSVTGAGTHVAAGVMPDGCDGCVGCDGGSVGDHRTCPATMCAVVPAIVPALDLDWPGTRAIVLAATDVRGYGRSPDPQTPPPRTTLLA